jgi:hypothetical protein
MFCPKVYANEGSAVLELTKGFIAVYTALNLCLLWVIFKDALKVGCSLAVASNNAMMVF